ncbi:MAG: O-antigen ligase family protein [Bacteroidia bacterium]
MLTALSDKKIFWLATGLFLLTAVYFTVLQIFWIYLLPAALLVILASLFRMDLVFFLTVLIVPLSINFDETPLGFGINVPTEPITFGLMLLMIFKIIMEGGIDKRILRHPVSILILLHLLWMMVCTVTSSLPLVSFKYTLARFSFVTVFYFYGIQLFTRAKNISKFAWFYIISLMIVIVYTTYNHAINFFSEAAAHSAMTPFYYDHTQYAAMIAMFLPLVIATLFGSEFSKPTKTVALFALLLLSTGLVLSYTRAVWVGVTAALLCSFIFIFRVHTSLVWAAIVTFLVLGSINISNIILNLETNKETSSTDFASHLLSVTNIKTDASNTERINRWSCAVRMFQQRPLTGWGPGTYQFIYGSFQLNSELTIISTSHGNLGNSHSEYLGPLSEEGLPGALFFIGIAIATIITASQFIVNSKSKKLRALAIGLILGMIAYWVHGFVNNFLHTEKASIPFWGFIGAIVALRIYHQDDAVENKTSVGF